MNQRLYKDNYTLRNKLSRLGWRFVESLFFRPFIGVVFNRWRIFLLKVFGAQIGRGCKVAATATFWQPWNISMGDFVCIADGVNCYTADRIFLGDYSTVSQNSYLCTASHDISFLSRPFVSAPIKIERHAWVCAEAFVGLGVTVGEGAIVAARAVVVRDVVAWKVVAGNPARVVKERVIETG